MRGVPGRHHQMLRQRHHSTGSRRYTYLHHCAAQHGIHDRPRLDALKSGSTQLQRLWPAPIKTRLNHLGYGRQHDPRHHRLGRTPGDLYQEPPPYPRLHPTPWRRGDSPPWCLHQHRTVDVQAFVARLHADLKRIPLGKLISLLTRRPSPAGKPCPPSPTPPP